MSDEQTPDGAADADDSIPKSKFQGVVKQRDEIKSKLRDLEAWKAEREAADEASNHEKMKAEKQYEKLISELQGKITTLAQERDGIAAEWQSKWEARETAERSDKFQSAIADKFPGVNRTVLRALMRELADGSGLDLAPEKLDSRTVDSAVAALKKGFPDVLTNKGNGAGGGPYIPGSPQRADGIDYKAMAQQHSQRMYGPKSG